MYLVDPVWHNVRLNELKLNDCLPVAEHVAQELSLVGALGFAVPQGWGGDSQRHDVTVQFEPWPRPDEALYNTRSLNHT